MTAAHCRQRAVKYVGGLLRHGGNPRPEGRRWVISSIEETLDAVVDLVDMADRRISIFTPDLEPGIYNNDRFLEASSG